jgi:C-terminal processing protease CtpA/Prc
MGREANIERWRLLRLPCEGNVDAVVIGAISYGPIDASTGYINIHHMMGCPSAHKAPDLDEALATMTKAAKIIVDVRFNVGGYDECALGFASRFTDRKRLVGTKETYEKGRWRNRRDIHFSPKGPVNTNARLIVLTSRGTVSAGEVFVMAMKTLPQAVIVGEPTEGMHSDIYERKLSNGWRVGLSKESYILPDGKIYEKIGLSPQIVVPFDGDVIEQGRDNILERALSL